MRHESLLTRVEKLEAEDDGPDAKLLASVTESEWMALAILRHELEHPRGAPITDEMWQRCSAGFGPGARRELRSQGEDGASE